VNGLLCGNDAEKCVEILFGDDALYVPYIIPGYGVYKDIEALLAEPRRSGKKDPHIFLLQNHGIFVGAETTDEIRAIYDEVFSKIQAKVTREMPGEELPAGDLADQILPGLGKMVSAGGERTFKVRNSTLFEYFSGSEADFRKISKPFTPDIIVYCKSDYIYCDAEGGTGEIHADLEGKIKSFEAAQGYLPRVILVKGLGLIAAGENEAGAETVLDIFEDFMKISWLSEFFGGQHFLTPDQIHFIDTWEVENFRRKIASKT